MARKTREQVVVADVEFFAKQVVTRVHIVTKGSSLILPERRLQLILEALEDAGYFSKDFYNQVLTRTGDYYPVLRKLIPAARRLT